MNSTNTKPEVKSQSKIIGNMYKEESTSDEIKDGDRVIHSMFGEGVVISVNGKIATIAFRHPIGVKQIAANHKYLQKR